MSKAKQQPDTAAGSLPSGTGGNSRPAWHQTWLFGLLLAVVVLLAYQPAWTGKPIWDDDGHLTRPELRSFDGLVRIWTEPGAAQQYYPLLYSVFWLEHKLWGDSVLGYHLVRILLHALCAILFFKVLRKLEVRGAPLAAAIFALHPVCVESVAWISELKNTLSGCFYLGAGLAYLEFDQRRSRKYYVIALLLFILGLLSKTVIATLPAALLVILWWKRGQLGLKRDIIPLLPFFITGAGAGLFTVWFERTIVGAQGSSYDYTLVERTLIAGRAFWFYLGKLIWPADLILIYPRWNISGAAGWQYLPPLAALLLLAGLGLLARRNRGPLAAALYFAGTLFPASGFLNVYPFRYSFVADHFQYLASLGVMALAAAGLVEALSRARVWGTKGGQALCLSLLAVLACLTWRQSRMYADMETLWRTTLAKNPECSMALNNLGNLLRERGQTEEAVVFFQRAVTSQPENAEAQNNLGLTLVQMGRVAEAIAHYRKALAVQPEDAYFHNNLGAALLRTGPIADALAHYERALAIDPENPLLGNNLAWVLATFPEPAGRNGLRAVELAERASRRLQGNNRWILGTLAAAYAEAGRFPEAIATTEQALRLAEGEGDASHASLLKSHLGTYQAGLPLRDPHLVIQAPAIGPR